MLHHRKWCHNGKRRAYLTVRCWWHFCRRGMCFWGWGADWGRHGGSDVHFWLGGGGGGSGGHAFLYVLQLGCKNGRVDALSWLNIPLCKEGSRPFTCGSQRMQRSDRSSGELKQSLDSVFTRNNWCDFLRFTIFNSEIRTTFSKQ